MFYHWETTPWNVVFDPNNAFALLITASFCSKIVNYAVLLTLSKLGFKIKDLWNKKCLIAWLLPHALHWSTLNNYWLKVAYVKFCAQFLKYFLKCESQIYYSEYSANSLTYKEAWWFSKNNFCLFKPRLLSCFTFSRNWWNYWVKGK